ncbi:MAG: HI0074 family nucleotidyltransferase substrate-binding subunit [Verrucomicrobiia bacterium]
MKLNRQLEDFQKALNNLADALRQAKSPYIRDSAILRFQLLFEIAWKTAQTFAADEGFVANSPKSAFQSAFKLGLIANETIWADILEARNLAVHVYRENLAESLYASLPAFTTAFEELYSGIRKRVRE